MGQNKITKAQWRELISNYILYCNTRRDLGLLVKTDNLRHISNTIWNDWNHIISTHCNRLSQSADFNELYERIEDLKIRGIGAQSMIETARQIAYKYDIPLDDSCWRVVVRKSPIIKLLGAPARDIKSYFARLSPDFGQLTSQQKIDFIITYQDKIRRLLTK